MHYLDVLNDTTATITSLEIVALINASRSEDQPVLLHKNFLAKVPRVLGLETSTKFLAHINVAGPRGGFRQSPIYSLPQREACLMAMSYSYELQAVVYDRMVELEEAAQAPAVQHHQDPASAAIAWSERYQASRAPSTLGISRVF